MFNLLLNVIKKHHRLNVLKLKTQENNGMKILRDKFVDHQFKCTRIKARLNEQVVIFPMRIFENVISILDKCSH